MSADGLFLGVDVGADDILCIIVGTGIGGGVITAGRVLEGGAIEGLPAAGGAP